MSCACCCCRSIVAGTLTSALTLPSNRFVPLIGDILIGVWKVNLRNAALFEEFLRVRGEGSSRGGGQATGTRAMISVSYHCISIRL